MNVLNMQGILSSIDFWAALFGALAGALGAFFLEAFRRWIANNAERQAAINLALLSLVQMYTVMRNYHDQVFVDGRANLLPLLPAGREPFPFEYLPAGGISEQQLAIDYRSLSWSLQSHDPDVLHRVLAAERIFLADRHTMIDHERLHRLVQRNLADGVDPAQPMTVGQLSDMAGADLVKQLNDVAVILRDKLPQDASNVLAAAGQLREVARAHFPTRSFIGFDVVPRKVATTPPSGALRPRWWRRLLRSITMTLRARRATKPEIG